MVSKSVAGAAVFREEAFVSDDQSREYDARRRRQARSRQAGTRGGRSPSQPVFGSVRIHLEIGDRIGAMCFRWIGVIRKLTKRIGLVRETNDPLDLFRR